jgi:hypothetical protein
MFKARAPLPREFSILSHEKVFCIICQPFSNKTEHTLAYVSWLDGRYTREIWAETECDNQR